MSKRSIYERRLKKILKPDQDFSKTDKKQKRMIEKIIMCDAALELLKQIAHEDVENTFTDIRCNRNIEDLPF